MSDPSNRLVTSLCSASREGPTFHSLDPRRGHNREFFLMEIDESHTGHGSREDRTIDCQVRKTTKSRNNAVCSPPVVASGHHKHILYCDIAVEIAA